MDLVREIRIVIISAALVIASSGVFAQGDVINDVKEAIKTGSSKEVAKFFSQNVELMLVEGNLQTYSKTQAEFVLKDFFKENPPSSFTIIHRGASKAGSPYAIGQYLSRGEAYRVWVRVKNVNNTYLIHEISFTKE